MDYKGLIVNVIAILAGLTLYIGIVRSAWGRAHTEYQYGIMLATIIFAVLVGGCIRCLL